VTTTDPLRIGVLGAARISDVAVVKPAHEIGARLVSVAARDHSRAQAFAERYGFERCADNYQDVIDDQDVEIIYNPLANALHAPWNIKAIEAGKHVLTEKPFASNATEARRVSDAAKASDVCVIEAFHHVYHPLTDRMLELAYSGEIGELRHVEVHMLMPPPEGEDPRWKAEMAGGSLMDLGCYAVQAVRDLAALSVDGEIQVISARGGEFSRFPGVDAWMSADMLLPGGVTAHFESSMAHAVVDSSWRLLGSEGEAFAPSFNKAQLDDRIIVTVGTEQRVEHLGTTPTYSYMLEAFTRLVRHGDPMRTDSQHAVETMSIIDDIYRKADMAPRVEWDSPS
jgi:predicted dehydrogenase